MKKKRYVEEYDPFEHAARKRRELKRVIKQACEEMAPLVKHPDRERAHGEADDIMERVVRQSGHRKLAKLYKGVTSNAYYA